MWRLRVSTVAGELSSPHRDGSCGLKYQGRDDNRQGGNNSGWPEPYMYGVYTVFLAEKSPKIRSYTVHIYGSGQP